MPESYQLKAPSPNHAMGLDNNAFEPDTQEKKGTNKHNEPPPGYDSERRPKVNDLDDDGGYSDDSDDDDPMEMNCCSSGVAKFQNKISTFFSDNSRIIKTIIGIVFLLGYFAYFGYAMWYEFGSEGSWRLLICTIIGVLILGRHLFVKYRAARRDQSEEEGDSDTSSTFAEKTGHCLKKFRVSQILQVLLVIGFIVFLAVDVAPNEPDNLVSLAGMAFFIISFYIFSFNPSKVKWRPVFWGLTIQIVFALLILRTNWGYEAFKWLGDRVTEFLAYTDAGSIFVFGNSYEDHYFAFKVLPVVIFFSTVVAMLYYLEVMQVFIRILGKFLSMCLGTTPTESINAAANIFIGQTEAPLLIRPFLKEMTKSEIHAVMTGGFATIAGGVMAAFIIYGVPANHLLSASVMSAPAALALSKLFYPETKKTRIAVKDVYRMTKVDARNLIEAASNGASMSISLVANIAVNLIAFVALLEFVNATLVWFGDRVGYGELTFQNICSYVFWPLAFLMGVHQDDCRKVAELIGIKTFLNEFVAYIELSHFIDNRKSLDEYIANATLNLTANWTGTWYEQDGGIMLEDTGVFLKEGLISDRSMVIATYALCGFSNLSSMGIQLGALGAMAPSRKGDMSRIVFRAMIAGNAACFMTACISGLLYQSQ